MFASILLALAAAVGATQAPYSNPLNGTDTAIRLSADGRAKGVDVSKLPLVAKLPDENTSAVVPSERGKTEAGADASLDWIDGTTLPLEGKPYVEADTYYARLPTSAKKDVVSGTWAMGHCTAGMSYVFKTTSRKLRVRWSLTSENLAMAHMAATGVSGVDFYAMTPEGWRFRKCGFPRKARDNEFEIAVKPGGLYRLYLPLYNGIAELKFGVENGKTLTAVPLAAEKKPVVFYGGSVVQGACVTRTGNAWVNIAGRDLDLPTVCMGFNGQGRMILPEAGLLAKIDASCYAFLCLGNMVQKTYREDAEAFLRKLHALKPDVPIVFCGYHYILEPDNDRNAFAADLERKLKAEDTKFWANFLIVTTGAMCPADIDGTVDGGHPNDYGARQMAAAFAAAVRAVLPACKGVGKMGTSK